MNIGIVGTRGIPNQYGGFEQFAEQFSIRLVEKGHNVTVYTSHTHTYKTANYKGVSIIRCYDPEYKIGTVGQFIYDFNCIRDTRKRNFDIILQLGYTSSTIWSWLYPGKSLLVTNMDGLEWLRGKYNKPTRYFLKHAERWGVKYSDHLIADSKGIQEYLRDKFKAQAHFVAYGANIADPGNDNSILEMYGLSERTYDLAIARFVPENNIETVLKAYARLPAYRLMLVGDYTNSAFGQKMFDQYHDKPNITFAGPIYDTPGLTSLRYHSRVYIHGHSAGGTNPSLLEAMAGSAVICAHDNKFNKYILEDDAYYFFDSDDLVKLITGFTTKCDHKTWIEHNKNKIIEKYNWDTITKELESIFEQWLAAER